MAKSIAYPSADFPGPAHIALDVPDDWGTVTLAGVHVAVAEPRRAGRFRANVVVTVQRHGADFTLDVARDALERRKAALPDIEDLGTGDLDIEGTAWIASEYGYTQTGRPTVVQAARYTVVPRGDAAVDVVEVVGSCGAEGAEEGIETLRAIQDSIRVTTHQA